MPLARWKRIAQQNLFENPWWKYRKDTFELPNGKQGEYHVVHTNGASLIVPLNADGSLVLVNQYRYLNDRESLEFPCGGVKEGATYESTAASELAEETGLLARDWKIVGEFNPFNGVTDEIARVFLASELAPTQLQSTRDETEEFEKQTLTPAQIDARIVSGVIWDGMTIAAWGIAKNFL